MFCFLDLAMHIFMMSWLWTSFLCLPCYYGILALIYCVTMLTRLACSLCASNHILFVVISHYFHACILMPCHCSCLAFVFVIFVMGSQKVYITFLIACIGHHGNDCKRTMIPNTLWVRRDVLPSSCGLYFIIIIINANFKLTNFHNKQFQINQLPQ